MANFDIAVNKTLEVEGVFSHDKDDLGGPTKYGITEAVARACGYAGEMKAMPLDTAKEIYRNKYWNTLGLQHFPDSAQAVANELFDTAVNMGVGKACAFLQSALNLLNKKATLWADIPVDGQMGPTTLDTVLKCLGQDARYRDALYKALNGEQYARYKEITAARPDNETFFLGWILRRL